MKKVLFVSILAGLALVGCTNDELVDNNVLGGNNEFIGFSVNQKNMTRGDMQNSHYEFGVFADNGATVMDNYLVAWADGTNLYTAFQSGASTYGDPTSQVNGLSYWFYEGLSATAGTDYNKADNTQILKFWDKSTSAYEFWAYAPYTTTQATAPTAMADNNAKQVTFSKTDDQFTFTGLSSFYTTPVVDGTTPLTQIHKADTTYATTKVATVADYNSEMVNYNEALYAYNKIEYANYEKDVPLTFEHINAKVNIAFYEEIEGYKVQLMDLVPEDIATAINSKTVKATKGVQLTPATAAQAIYYDNVTTHKYLAQAAATALPTYYDKAQVVVNTVSDGANATYTVGNNTDATVNDNLYFQPTNATGTTSYTVATTSGTETVSTYISEDGAQPTKSETVLYTLPNVSKEATPAYITYAPAAGENISKTTGYTLHVSYALIPQDGSAKIQIYDARVYIPAEYCQWKAGTSYTYVFKITKNANGTTDPVHEIDKYTASTTETTDDEPYVDPRDPRVPDDAALNPIVFDAILVADYAETTVSPVFVITEGSLADSYAKALNSLNKIFTTGGTTLAGLQTISGTGTTSDPYTLTYTAKVGDFKWPSWETTGWTTPGFNPATPPSDINDNNVFKDLQAISQAFFNQGGIETINTLTNLTPTVAQAFSRDYGQTPPSWYGAGLSLEGTVANSAFVSMLGSSPYEIADGDAATVYLELVDDKTPANKIYVQINLSVIAD